MTRTTIKRRIAIAVALVALAAAALIGANGTWHTHFSANGQWHIPVQPSNGQYHTADHQPLGGQWH
jgi:hypothetical protein